MEMAKESPSPNVWHVQRLLIIHDHVSKIMSLHVFTPLGQRGGDTPASPAIPTNQSPLFVELHAHES